MLTTSNNMESNLMTFSSTVSLMDSVLKRKIQMTVCLPLTLVPPTHLSHHMLIIWCLTKRSPLPPFIRSVITPANTGLSPMWSRVIITRLKPASGCTHRTTRINKSKPLINRIRQSLRQRSKWSANQPSCRFLCLEINSWLASILWESIIPFSIETKTKLG